MMLEPSVNTIPATVVSEPALSEVEFEMAASECALAFPYVDFANLPGWMQLQWLQDALERQDSARPVPCPVD